MTPTSPVVTPKSPAPEPVVQERPAAAAAPEPVKPTIIVSELDAYIHERIQNQPTTVEEVVSRAEVTERTARLRHRLSLPEYFERQSYDHPEHKGPYVFRWLNKSKRALDHALNDEGWTLVTKVYFPGASRHLFVANGGVEVGDAILAFMPAKRAVMRRDLPGQLSRGRLESRMTTVGQNRVLMTGNPNDPNVYTPDLGKEAGEGEEITPGAMVEGRDF